MPEIKDKNFFEPNQIKKIWLSTRKENIPGTDHPGFFQTVGFTTDKTWFYIVCAIELAAIFITIQGGALRGFLYLIIAIAAVVIFVFFDFIGAKLHHDPISLKQEKKCELSILKIKKKNENEKKDILEEKKVGILDEINSKSSRKLWGTALIIISAVLKLVALFLLGTMGFVFLGIMTLLYILAIYIHLNHTGYFIAEYNTKRKINKQNAKWRNYNRWLKNNDEAKALRTGGEQYVIPETPKKFDIESEIQLWNHEEKGNREIVVGNHKLIYLKESNNQFTYELQTKGILTDYDVRQFLSTGNRIDRKKVALHLLEKQMELASN